MSEVVALKTQTVLEPIDGAGLSALSAKGKANPQSVVTLKARTVCESKFRNLTYVRNLEAHVIDEPPRRTEMPSRCTASGSPEIR